jgi:hypothetical protein
MTHTPDTGQTTPGGTPLDPKDAAALLDQTTQTARRKFDPNPPLLSVLRAIVVLGAFGAIWLSVRDQHPYKGPNGWAIGVTYLLVALVIGASAGAMKRASAGVTGDTLRQRRASIAVLLVAWIAVYAFEGALYHAGVSHAIVYGLYPATAPFMIVGLVGAANAAGRQDWPMLATTLTVGVVATVAAFGGPAGCWLIMGIGLFVAMLGTAVTSAWRQRRSLVRP